MEGGGERERGRERVEGEPRERERERQGGWIRWGGVGEVGRGGWKEGSRQKAKEGRDAEREAGALCAGMIHFKP